MRVGSVAATAADKAMPYWGALACRLRDGLASLRLAIGLFITIAIVAAVGTVIPQGEPAERYVKEYGEFAARALQAFGLTDLYHAWWFASLLVLLCVNSLTCFFRRFPAIWRSLRQDKTAVTLPFILGLKAHLELDVGVERDALARDIAATLGEKGYRMSVRRTGEEITLFATKGVMGRIGAHVAHLSVPVILLGGLLGVVFGFRDFGAGVEGETYYIPQGGFSLRVDRFWMDYYDTGGVKSYNTTLTVIDGGREALTKTIRVNDPLEYKGIRFYQSSYGEAWDRVEKVRVLVSDRETGKALRDVLLEWRKETVLDDIGITMAATAFVADFDFNPHEKVVFSKSVEHRNPAVQIVIAEKERGQAPLWLLYEYPDLVQMQDSKYRYELIGYMPRKFTGLQIAKDPGAGTVWAGSTALVVGLTLSAFIYHRRIWVKLVPGGRGTIVYIGGSSHKNQMDFRREFDGLSQRITRVREGGTATCS
jgi:cytochrome c biogenesis protein